MGLQPLRSPAVPSSDGRWDVASIEQWPTPEVPSNDGFKGSIDGGLAQTRGTFAPPAPSDNRAPVAQQEARRKKKRDSSDLVITENPYFKEQQCVAVSHPGFRSCGRACDASARAGAQKVGASLGCNLWCSHGAEGDSCMRDGRDSDSVVKLVCMLWMTCLF